MKRSLMIILCVLCLAYIADAATIDNIALYAKLEEASSPYNNEVAGMADMNGTNTPDRISALIGYGQRVDVGDSEKMEWDAGNTSDSFSINLWWNGSLSANSYPVNKFKTFSWGSIDYYTKIGTTGTLEWQVGKGGSGHTDFSCANIVPANHWTMLTFTHNNSDTTLRMYVNGTECDSANLGGVIQHNSEVFNFGQISVYSNNQYDEIGFWNRTLTPAEIVTIFNSGSGFQYPFINVTNTDLVTDANATAVLEAGAFILYANYSYQGNSSAVYPDGTCNYTSVVGSGNMTWDGSRFAATMASCTEGNHSITINCSSPTPGVQGQGDIRYMVINNSAPVFSFGKAADTTNSVPYNVTMACTDICDTSFTYVISVNSTLNHTSGAAGSTYWYNFTGGFAIHDFNGECVDAGLHSANDTFILNFGLRCVPDISGIVDGGRYIDSTLFLGLNCSNAVNISSCDYTINEYQPVSFNCSVGAIDLERGKNDLNITINRGDVSMVSVKYHVWAKKKDATLFDFPIIFITALICVGLVMLALLMRMGVFHAVAGVCIVLLGFELLAVSLPLALIVMIVGLGYAIAMI